MICSVFCFDCLDSGEYIQHWQPMFSKRAWWVGSVSKDDFGVSLDAILIDYVGHLISNRSTYCSAEEIWAI